MKKYKNTLLSLGSYIVALLWLNLWIFAGNILYPSVSPLAGNILNKLVLVGFFILLFVGIFFGFKSNKKRESSWAGNLMIAVGILGASVYLLLMTGFIF